MSATEKVSQEQAEENFRERVRYHLERVEDIAGIYSDDQWREWLDEKLAELKESEDGYCKDPDNIEVLAYASAILHLWGTHRGIKNSPMMIG